MLVVSFFFDVQKHAQSTHAYLHHGVLDQIIKNGNQNASNNQDQQANNWNKDIRAAQAGPAQQRANSLSENLMAHFFRPIGWIGPK